MVKYFENFASSFLKKDIENEILKSPNWMWQYRSETSGQYEAPDYAWIEDENTEDSPQLIHIIHPESKDMLIVSPLIYKISEILGYRLQFQRIKVNLLWPNATRKNLNSYHRPHSDHGRPDAKTLIYYVNDSDGDTIIFKNTWTGQDPGKLEINQRISPKAGSAILFDSALYHASSSPTQNVRSVINFIFWPMDSTTEHPDIPPIPTNVPVGKGFHNL